MKHTPPITMKDLAAEAGVSIATVSLALRNDPRLRPETRERLLDLARKRGYRPDPALSALVAYRARTRPAADYGVIGILHDMGEGERPPISARSQIEGIIERGRDQGYGAELFYIGTDDESSMRLSRILYARGIRGVILMTLRRRQLRMEWEHFSAVVIGEYFSSPHFVHICNHHASMLSATYEGLRSLGYRRIGFCNGRIYEERKNHLYLGAYLKCLYLDGLTPGDCPPLLHEEEPWSPLPWLDRHGFDAVMTMVPETFIAKLAGSRYRVPATLGVAAFSRPATPGTSNISGCALDYKAMGVRAMEVLQSMIQSGRRGVPGEGEYFDVLIRGHWLASQTTRPQPPPRQRGAGNHLHKA